MLITGHYKHSILPPPHREDTVIGPNVVCKRYITIMEALNTKVELEKEGGGRGVAEDEEAYPIIIDLICLIKKNL